MTQFTSPKICERHTVLFGIYDGSFNMKISVFWYQSEDREEDSKRVR